MALLLSERGVDVAQLARKRQESQRLRSQLQRRRVLRVWSCALRILLSTDRQWRKRLKRLLCLWHRASKREGARVLQLETPTETCRRVLFQAQHKMLKRILHCWAMALAMRKWERCLKKDVEDQGQLSQLRSVHFGEVQRKDLKLQALHLWLRSLLRRWAAAAQLLQRRRQRSTAAWEALRERRLHGSIQGWHLWATSSASRQRRCQAAELQHRLRLQQFLAQLLKTWCHVARSSCRRREEMSTSKESHAMSVLQKCSWDTWISFVELQRDRDATAEQWHQVMVVEGCRSALSNWHQATLLHRSYKALSHRRRLQQALAAVCHWKDFIQEQQRMACLLDAYSEKRKRLAKRRAIFSLYQQAQIKSYSRQLLLLTGEKAKQLLMAVVRRLVSTWSAFVAKKRTLSQYVVAFRMQQAHAAAQRALQKWRGKRQQRRLQRLAQGCWLRVATDAARRWLRVLHVKTARRRRQSEASHAKFEALLQETKTKSFEAWQLLTRQQHNWRCKCDRASQQLAAKRCGKALRYLHCSAIFKRRREHVRESTASARCHKVLRLWFGLAEVSRQQRSAKVQTQKAFITRLRVRCRQSQLNKAAAWYDCCRLEGLAFLSWQLGLTRVEEKSQEV